MIWRPIAASLCFIGLPIVLVGCNADQSSPEREDKRLVWSDEFEGTALNRNKWTPELSCWGGGNNERQCYVDASENIRVEDGILVLTARPETVSGFEFPQDLSDRGAVISRDFTSGKIRTKGLQSWTYGRFAARIKLPKGQSTWSAFWMLPEDNVYGGWPKSGEIDIMEAVNLGELCETCPDGKEDRSIAAVHFGELWPNNQSLSHKKSLDFSHSESWHVYSVDWREDQIQWAVDDIIFFSIKPQDWRQSESPDLEPANIPFDKPFHLILNLAVGGNLPDTQNAKAFNPNSFPADMKVDWVRVYE